jgi:hypothetical protein
MFCIFAMNALIFVLPTLCCAPSRAYLCYILHSIAFIMHVCMSHPVLRSNRMLIVCVSRNQVYTYTVQKMDTE